MGVLLLGLSLESTLGKKTIKLNSHKTLNCLIQTMCVNTFHSRILQYGVEGSTVPQLPTHHLSILLTPGRSRGVCTNCPPYTTAANLYSTSIWKCHEKSSDKPYRVFLTAAGLSCGTNWCPLYLTGWTFSRYNYCLCTLCWHNIGLNKDSWVLYWMVYIPYIAKFLRV